MKLKITLAVAASLVVMFAGWSIAKEFEPATIEEIQSVVAQSHCVKKLLSDANRDATEIRRRDLKSVQALCFTIDEQAKAF